MARSARICKSPVAWSQLSILSWFGAAQKSSTPLYPSQDVRFVDIQAVALTTFMQLDAQDGSKSSCQVYSGSHAMPAMFILENSCHPGDATKTAVDTVDICRHCKNYFASVSFRIRTRTECQTAAGSNRSRATGWSFHFWAARWSWRICFRTHPCKQWAMWAVLGLKSCTDLDRSSRWSNTWESWSISGKIELAKWICETNWLWIIWSLWQQVVAPLSLKLHVCPHQNTSCYLYLFHFVTLCPPFINTLNNYLSFDFCPFCSFVWNHCIRTVLLVVFAKKTGCTSVARRVLPPPCPRTDRAVSRG